MRVAAVMISYIYSTMLNFGMLPLVEVYHVTR